MKHNLSKNRPLIICSILQLMGESDARNGVQCRFPNSRNYVKAYAKQYEKEAIESANQIEIIN